MALVDCEECGRQISNRAVSCPHCGCPATPTTKPENKAAVPPPLSANATTPGVLPAAWQENSEASVAASNHSIPLGAAPATSVLARIAQLAIALAGVVFIYSCATSTNDADIDKAISASGSATVSTAAAPVARTVPSESDRLRHATTLADETAGPGSRLGAARALIKDFPNTPDGVKAAQLAPELEKARDYELMGGQWMYGSQEEGMSGKSSRHARVISRNTINLDFPYAGNQHATLTLRRHPRWGNDVILSIDQGQILCHTYGDCSIGVRFDDGKILRLNGNPPSDNSTETVFIPAFDRFMRQLPNTKTVKIEISVYQGGAPVFEFDVSGFKPEKFK